MRCKKKGHSHWQVGMNGKSKISQKNNCFPVPQDGQPGAIQPILKCSRIIYKPYRQLKWSTKKKVVKHNWSTLSKQIFSSDFSPKNKTFLKLNLDFSIFFFSHKSVVFFILLHFWKPKNLFLQVSWMDQLVEYLLEANLKKKSFSIRARVK